NPVRLRPPLRTARPRTGRPRHTRPRRPAAAPASAPLPGVGAPESIARSAPPTPPPPQVSRPRGDCRTYPSELAIVLVDAKPANPSPRYLSAGSGDPCHRAVRVGIRGRRAGLRFVLVPPSGDRRDPRRHQFESVEEPGELVVGPWGQR